MKEKHKKLKKQILILSVIPIASVLLIALLYIFANSDNSGVVGFILLVLLISSAISIILLPVKLFSFISLKKHKEIPEDVMRGIDLKKMPDLIDSGIYCGDNALFASKEKLFIPYDDFAWTYYMKINLYHLFNAHRAVICFKNAKAIEIKCTREELAYIINKHVIPRSPEVLVGYNKENIKEYRRRCKEWKKQR